MAFLVTAQVLSENHFPELTRAVEVSVNRALVEAGELLLNEVRSNAPVGSDPRGPGPHTKGSPSGSEHLADSFRMTPSIGRSGFRHFANVVVWTRNPVAIWQELGTLARRVSKLKDGSSYTSRGQRREKSGQFSRGALRSGGVAPTYFMRRSLQAVEPAMFALIQRAVAQVGTFGGGSSLVDTTSVHNPAKSAGVRSRPW